MLKNEKNIFHIHLLHLLFFSLVVGHGDVTFNPRRNILGSIPVGAKTTYHLHSIEYCGQKGSYSVQLLRKSKWHAQYSTAEGKWYFNVRIQWSPSHQDNTISSLDFNSSGEIVATIDRNGACLVSDVNTDSCCFHMEMGENGISCFISNYLFHFHPQL